MTPVLPKLVWDAKCLNSEWVKRHLTNRCDNIQLINPKNLWKIWYELDLNDREILYKENKILLNDRNKINWDGFQTEENFTVTYISSYKGLQTCFFK